MTASPLIEIRDVVKNYAGPQPLRVSGLRLAASDRIVLHGLGADAAEMFVLLVTGAALPDDGSVVVSGRDTRGIATDTDWLVSLDRFGIVTRRAVLLEKLSVAANLALPRTVVIDPLTADMQTTVERDAREVGLAAELLMRPAGDLGEEDKLRLHLARAAANGAEFVILEHPTTGLEEASMRARFGEALRRFSASRGFGWVAISDDAAFARTSGGRRMSIDAGTGRLAAIAGWRRLLGL